MPKIEKFLPYAVVVLDVLAVLVFQGIIQCSGINSAACKESQSSPLSWLIIVVAVAATGFYLYKRRQSKLPLLHFSTNPKYGYLIAAFDVVAFIFTMPLVQCLAGTSAECRGTGSSLAPWIIPLIAVILTAYYMFNRHQAHLSLMPFPVNPLSIKPNMPWIYAIYYFFALIFFGENGPEIAGYLKGLPLGAPGTHASLMNPALFFTGNSQTLENLLVFFGISVVIAFAFRKLNFLTAFLVSVALGTSAEIWTQIGKTVGGPEGFDLVNNTFGTILTYVLIWSYLVLVPFFLFILFKRWGDKGITALIILMVIANIGFYFFSKYEMEVLKNVQPGFLGGGQDSFLPENTCPDRIAMENSKTVVYKDGKLLFVKDPAFYPWIYSNCPNMQNDLPGQKIQQ